MTSSNPLPTPVAAPRGVVQKTFATAKILAGFTDPGHFQLLAGEYLATLDATAKAAALQGADTARAYVAQLPPLAPYGVIVRPVTHSHVDAIRNDPLFAQTLGQSQYQFSYINPAGLIALQAWIEPRADVVPTTEDALLDFALPRTWDVAAEVSFMPPLGPIQILSSNPAMQGLALELDQTTGTVKLSAPKHLNLVQVVQFNNLYFLKNGYHRVSDALAAGVQEFPAIVISALSANDVALPGVGAFNLGYVLGQQRPPLVNDFHSPAAVKTKVRERRYGTLVSLDVKAVNIGI
jgi:hypothetical protein